MELFDEHIEQVIISKEYFELSPEEKDGIKDFISNEEEYTQFKATLLMATDLPKENIQPKKDTKASLMSMMESSRPERKIWYNSIGVFLFPEDKPAFAKPGIYASLAAILLLVFFLVPMDFGTVGSSERKTAMEENASEDAKSKDMAPSEESIVSGEQEPTAKTVTEDLVSEDESYLDAEKKKEEIEMNDNEVLAEEIDELDDNVSYNWDANANGGGDLNNKNIGNNAVTIDYAARMNNKEAKKLKGGLADSTVLNAPVPGFAGNGVDKDARFKDDQKNFISGDLKKDGFTYEILNDNALNQSDELIDLLYTAD